jgi:ATP-dependent protease ClpP protease subunit
MMKPLLLMILCGSLCACVHAAETDSINKSNISTTSVEVLLPTSLAHPIPALINPSSKLPVMVYFIGKVTLKKANDLITWIYKQFNEGVNEFIISINSSGGDTDAGISIYQALKALPISITTINIASTQSSAAMIYCVGNQRYSLPYSFFMLHGNSLTYNNSMSLKTVESFSQLSQIYADSFVAFFKTCTTLDTAQLQDYFSTSTTHYFTALQAQAIGLTQYIGQPTLKKLGLIYSIND